MTSSFPFTAIIGKPHQGMRLDKAVAALYPELSRTRVQALLARGGVLLDGRPAASSAQKVAAGQELTVVVPETPPAVLIAEEIPLDVLFEDSHLLVLHKPAGLVVHPAAGNWSGTLVNALMAHCGDSLAGIGGMMRPGIVHRLDKDTSGVMVVAKNDAAHRSLAQQFADRTLERSYQAIVWGAPPAQEGLVEAPVARHPVQRKKMAVVQGGKPAATQYRLLKRGLTASMLHCRLLSGRTHQVRVHMAHLGCPLVGDPLYGRKRLPAGTAPLVKQFSRQALHAATLGFVHPASGETLRFERPVPEDMQQLWQALTAPAA